MTHYLRMPVGFGPTGNPRFSPVSHIEYDPATNHKYIPAMCQPDAAEVDFLLVTPVGGPALRVIEHHSAQQAQLSINRARWEDMPTQFQIVNRLAEVPLLEVVQAGIFSAQGGNNLGNQHRIT